MLLPPLHSGLGAAMLNEHSTLDDNAVAIDNNNIYYKWYSLNTYYVSDTM